MTVRNVLKMKSDNTQSTGTEQYWQSDWWKLRMCQNEYKKIIQ